MDKLDTLVEEWGFESVDDLLAAYIVESMVPGICMNSGCDYSTEIEPDSDDGWCACCETQSVSSAFVLAGII